MVARKPVPLNTLINSDNVNEFFATVEVKTAPEGVVKNPDDLKGRYIVRSVEAGQYLYKSLTGNEWSRRRWRSRPARSPRRRTARTVVASKKTRFPRFDQVIQAGGGTPSG